MNVCKVFMVFTSIFKRIPMPQKYRGFFNWLASMIALFASLYELGKELGMTTIDVSQMGVPNEYLPIMLIIVIPVVTFFGYLISMQSYNDVLKAKGKTKEEMPYDNKYLVASIASIIMGIAGGIYLIPIGFSYAGIVGAGAGLYGVCAAILGTIIMWGLTRVTHCGIDVLITDVQKLNAQAATITETAKETVSNVNTAVSELEKQIDTAKKS